MSDPARIYFRDAGYDGQLARTLALVTDGCADLGEAFAAARGGGPLHTGELAHGMVCRRRAGPVDCRGRRCGG